MKEKENQGLVLELSWTRRQVTCLLVARYKPRPTQKNGAHTLTSVQAPPFYLYPVPLLFNPILRYARAIVLRVSLSVELEFDTRNIVQIRVRAGSMECCGARHFNRPVL